jgi:amino acid transporter/nucleotide-binding universal stress UspA family protein
MAEEPPGAARPAPEIELHQPAGRGVGYLGPALAWAVVFADLGTSVYYVPAILYAQVGGLAPVFVLVAAVAFIFVALGHLETARRYPKGGGGVAAATEAFGPRVGVVSGALMVSAYLLTITISVVTALHYIAAIRPFAHEIPVLSVAALLLLGTLHWVGVRELPRVALAMGLAALACEVVLVWVVLSQVPHLHWAAFWTSFKDMTSQHWAETATGFAAAWLAFSGLESLGQLAPALREPRARVLRIVAVLVLVSLVITVPVFTVIGVEAAQARGIGPHPALLAAVAEAYGGRGLLVALSLTGAGFLLVGANVAFIGCYNVFKAVGELGYLPAAMAMRHKRFGTPRVAIVAITIATVLLVITTGGELFRLGKVFAFGLLGSYTITAISMAVISWREKRRGPMLIIDVLSSLALVIPWVTTWFTKPVSTLYGVAVTGLQLMVAFVTHRGWIRSGRFGYLRAASAERAAAAGPATNDVITLEEAVALRSTYPSTTVVALRGANKNLCREAARRARGAGDAAVYVIFVDQIPGLFFPPRTGPSDDALEVLEAAVVDIGAEGLQAVPIWRLAHNAGASIAEAAEELEARCVLMGTTARSAVWQFLRGDVLKELLRELPEQVHVVICE